MKKNNSKSHHELSDEGSVYLAPRRTGEDMRKACCDPEGGPIRGHGLPKSVSEGIGYPDSILTITKRKAGSAFPKNTKTIRVRKD